MRDVDSVKRVMSYLRLDFGSDVMPPHRQKRHTGGPGSAQLPTDPVRYK